MIEDRAAVLRTVIAELGVFLGRIDIAPENFQQLLVGHLRWIVFDEDRFGMAGAPRRNLLVGRILGLSADVSGGRRHDAGDFVECFFHAPKAASGESRLRSAWLGPWCGL